jgi:hypothetical protein
MSKTDRTMPYWVRAKNHPGDTEVSHSCADHPSDDRYAWGRLRAAEPCDLDSGPHTNCRRSFINNRYDSHISVPGWYIAHHWTRPDRGGSRAECRDALRDYNANGDTDVIVRAEDHRHTALWWWY